MQQGSSTVKQLHEQQSSITDTSVIPTPPPLPEAQGQNGRIWATTHPSSSIEIEEEQVREAQQKQENEPAPIASRPTTPEVGRERQKTGEISTLPSGRTIFIGAGTVGAKAAAIVSAFTFIRTYTDMEYFQNHGWADWANTKDWDPDIVKPVLMSTVATISIIVAAVGAKKLYSIYKDNQKVKIIDNQEHESSSVKSPSCFERLKVPFLSRHIGYKPVQADYPSPSSDA